MMPPALLRAASWRVVAVLLIGRQWRHNKSISSQGSDNTWPKWNGVMNEEPAHAALTVRIPKACHMTGIGRSKFYELIAAGEIETITIGAMTLVPVESLYALLNRYRSSS